MDVKTAFLSRELEEEIQMQQPQGYEQGGPNMVYRLRRTLYGLRQTPRVWHLHLRMSSWTFGFVASMADAALFTRIVFEERIYLGVVEIRALLELWAHDARE
ncbi:hypothetical protein KFL_013680010 [Klebsormidium nitens]|uniref:Reverse transcriptase Ty1/copia-type domain-containing protein n=1 Tax=Klebsormidium nitens TaxID=105231 RepID=A0A1Y1IY29_KLENI|nr:hypothetical protein KFL_013680010 [Klebsormidium nitens]|eukprot:GAQ93218.1 hypothetical protein KFL_013680010 [Klebsormidium nitens]